MGIPGWLKGVLSIFVSSEGETNVGASVSVPFGGPDPNAPDQPREIPEDVKKQGWSKDIHDCHDRIRKAWPTVKSEWEQLHPGYSLKCDYTYRSPEFQFELYKKGRSLIDGKWVVTDPSKKVTDKDGKNPSHHNVYPAQAVDVYILSPSKNIIWENPQLYTELGRLWEKHGLIAGATWKFNWKDYPHVQVEYSIV